MTDSSLPLTRDTLSGRIAGPFWLLVATVAAAIYFREGLDALLSAWATPEYSHGPIIPLLSAFMFLQELKAAGYSGIVSVETFRPEYWAKTPEWVIPNAYKTTRAALAENGCL